MAPQAKQFLIDQGWDPQYGARPLKRAIQRHIEDELAKRILGAEFRQGDTIAVGRSSGGELTFSKLAMN
jgi:ATP-dependent Clp protease ATP-binding subunit ClpB